MKTLGGAASSGTVLCTAPNKALHCFPGSATSGGATSGLVFFFVHLLDSATAWTDFGRHLSLGSEL